MDHQVILAGEEQNKRRGMILSIVIHLLLLLICFLPLFFQKPISEDQISGIIVQLGIIEGGSEKTDESTPELTQTEEAVKPITPAPIAEASTAKEVIKKEATKAEKTNLAAAVESKSVDDEAEIIATKKAEAAKKEAEMKKAADAKKAAEAADKKAAEEKAAAAAKKQAEYDEKKKKFGSLLSGGQGNNDNSGSQGDPDGDPNTKALENLATGSGSIGEGLSDRTIEYKPVIKDDSQKTGKVVIDICINKQGKVISAKYTQKGSTTSDKDLIDVAETGVRKYRFSAGDADKQCGSIIIDFKLK